MLSDRIEIPAAVLGEALARLMERRVMVEKEVLKYGEAPATVKQVFELARGFERAYVNYVNESPVASKIKEAFMGEKGLAGAVRKLPMEKVFELSNVKKVCRQSDGYQPHLVSPETGLRQLATEALDQVEPPVHQAVQAVYNLLINAAREAAEKAGQFTEAALMGAMPMYVPDFKNVVMPAIVAAMDEWSKEANRVALMLVDMERSYISAGFFRHTMYHRANRIKQQQAMTRTAEAATSKGGAAAPQQRSFFPAFGSSQPAAPPLPAAPAAQPLQGQPAATPAPGPKPVNDAASDASGDETSGSPPKAAAASASGGGLPSMSDPNDFIAAFFEKYNSSESSLPTSWRWQKRFFIFSDSQRMLYYFKTPEDVPKPNGLRGQMSVVDCVIEDLDERGNPRGPGQQITNPSDKNHLMIRIRHKDPRQAAVKDHNSIVLRADTLQQKLEWLTRLRRAAEGPKRPAPAAPGADGEGSQKAAAAAAPAVDDLTWAQDAEPIIDTHLGEGARAFRAETVRDSDGRLLLAPNNVLNPMRLAERVRKLGVGMNFEARYDALLEQCAGDMSVYMRMVCDTVVTTTPKAIVHCMIRKSEKNLLERLFTVIHHLTPNQMEALLREDDAVVGRRAAARRALEDVKTAMFELQQIMERMSTGGDRPDKVNVHVNVAAYAAMPDMLTQEQKNYYDKFFNEQYAIDALRNWTAPPVGIARPLPSPARGSAQPEQHQHQQPVPQQQAPQVPPRPQAAPMGAPAPGRAPPVLAAPSMRRAPPPPPTR